MVVLFTFCDCFIVDTNETNNMDYTHIPDSEFTVYEKESHPDA